MRRWMLAGNWKMHNTIQDSVALARAIVGGTEGVDGGDVVIAPVFTALVSVKEVIKGSGVALSGQDVFYEEKGAFTGEIAPAMLKDAGCEFVIIGHSERRKYFHETDETVNAKVKKALSSGLKPIMCVGETEEEREKGITEFVVGLQVKKGLYGIEDLSNVTIAYEPVWAIGTGKNATPEQAEAVHAFIRRIVKDAYGQAAAGNTRILYGGSVTPENIGQLIAMEDIDGALIGGASLKSESFIGIIKTVAGRCG
ncbi:MAG: Bifunctional PGK [Syntrophorhabdaceae bacterium PtaU1.Bin034]|jgi:triosephosphate isomerase|nr:MAG: Bifunctional PGK [Syntrophorhabdaceae bacterium PtaU1.Bin034]